MLLTEDCAAGTIAIGAGRAAPSALPTHTLVLLPFPCCRVRRRCLQTLHRKLLASLRHVVPEVARKGRSWLKSGAAATDAHHAPPSMPPHPPIPAQPTTASSAALAVSTPATAIAAAATVRRAGLEMLLAAVAHHGRSSAF